MRRRTKVGRGRRRARLGVEDLESRRLMAVSFNAVALPTPEAAAFALTIGPGGNVWYAGRGSITQNGMTGTYDAIGVVDATTHKVTEYPIPVAGSIPQGLTFGTDGNLWFTDLAANAIGEFNTTTHQFTEFATPTALSEPYGIAPAPDGSLFFTEFNTGKIGVINATTHHITEYPLPAADLRPTSIVAGPDGGFWFTQQSAVASATLMRASIGRIDYATRAITQYNSLIDSPVSQGITLGKDGQLWFGQFADPGGPEVASIDPHTGVVSTTPLVGSALAGFATGADGTIDYQEFVQPLRSPGILYIGQIDPTSHTLDRTVAPGTLTRVGPLIAAPDGTLWAGGNGVLYQIRPIAPGQSAITGTIMVSPNGDVASSTTPAVSQTLFLDLNNDGKFDPGDPTAVSDIFGNYTFAGLAPGTYTVRVVPFVGDVTTSPPNGAQSVIAAADGLNVAGAIGFASTSSLLPTTYSTNPFGVHNPDISTAEVNGLYTILFNRAADPGGLANAVSYLKGGGSLKTLTLILEDTAEYKARVVAQDYLNFVGRVPTGGELDAWIGAMDRGTSAEGVAYLMLTSAGFNATHPTDASYVQALYTGVLGRQASPVEVAGWVSAIASGLGRSSVAFDFVFGTAAMTRAVDGFGSIFWAQTPDPATEQYTVAYLVSGKVALGQVASSFASAAQFIARANTTVG